MTSKCITSASLPSPPQQPWTQKRGLTDLIAIISSCNGRRCSKASQPSYGKIFEWALTKKDDYATTKKALEPQKSLKSHSCDHKKGTVYVHGGLVYWLLTFEISFADILLEISEKKSLVVITKESLSIHSFLFCQIQGILWVRQWEGHAIITKWKVQALTYLYTEISWFPPLKSQDNLKQLFS